MGTYTDAYKSGNITGVTGTVCTVSGFTPAASDVGRLLIVTSGAARLQHREITAVSGQTVTIAHDWTDSNLLGIVDVDPVAGGATPTCAISYDASDLIALDADFVLTNNTTLAVAALNCSGGAYVHFKNYNVVFHPGDFEIGNTGGVIFGYYQHVAGEDCYTVDPCTIVLTSGGSGGDQMAQQVGGIISFGLCDIYGGTVTVPRACFLRCYRSDFGLSQVRWIDCHFAGNFGSRTGGSRSCIIASSSGSQSNLGLTNPQEAVARIEISVTDSLQCLYAWLQEGAAGHVRFTRIRDVSGRILRVLTTGYAAASNAVLNIEARKSEIDAAPVLAAIEGASAATHTIRFGNFIRPNFIDATTAAVTEPIKTVLTDSAGTVVNSQTITGATSGGRLAEFWARHTDVNSLAGNRNLSDGTQYAPYLLRASSWGRQILSQPIDAEDVFEPALTLLADLLITEPVKAAVDEYTLIDTPEKFYDRAAAWLYDNYAGEGAQLVVRNGTEIDAGADSIVIDATAVAVLAYDAGTDTITIKSTSYSGDLTTTGNVTLVNGALLSDAVVDADLSVGENNLMLAGIDITDGHQLTVTVAGNYTLSNCDIDTVENTSGGAVTLTLAGGTAAPTTLTETSGTIALRNNMTLIFTGTTSDHDLDELIAIIRNGAVVSAGCGSR